MSDDFQQRGGSPWGTPPGGGSGNGSGRGPTPPDVDKIIRESFKKKLKNFYQVDHHQAENKLYWF